MTYLVIKSNNLNTLFPEYTLKDWTGINSSHPLLKKAVVFLRETEKDALSSSDNLIVRLKRSLSENGFLLKPIRQENMSVYEDYSFKLSRFNLIIQTSSCQKNMIGEQRDQIYRDQKAAYIAVHEVNEYLNGNV